MAMLGKPLERKRVHEFKSSGGGASGARIGTITDVGTVLIHFKTNDGCLRVACPWESR